MDSFDFGQLLLKFRYPFLLLLSGLILALFGVFIFKSGVISPQTKIEVLEGTRGNQERAEMMAEISGGVIKPGVYKMPPGSRVEDLLTIAGGFSQKADRVWTDRYLNRASLLTDGQKVFIPEAVKQTLGASDKTEGGDQTVSSTFSSDSNSIININTASLEQLDSLPGIGQVYGQSIIEHRPYSTTSELVSRGVLKQSVYQKIKDRVSVY